VSVEVLLADARAAGAIYPIDVLDFARGRGLGYPETRALFDAWLAAEDPRARYRRMQAADAFASDFADRAIAALRGALGDE